MLHIPVILGHRPRSLYRRDEIWSNRPYDKVLPQNAHSDESGLRRTGDGLSASQQRECRDIKDDFKRKCSSSSHYSRQWSPYKGTSCFFRKSNIGQKDSPHRRSGSSGGHSPKGSEQYSSHWSQLRTSTHANASYRWDREEKPEGGQNRPGQSWKTSGDTYPLSSLAVPSSEILDKLNNFDENGLPEATSRQAVENPKMADEGDLPKISEFEVGFTEPLLMDQPQEPESNRTEGTELVSDQRTDRLKAIASKTKEIEQAYHQDCETFGMVVKMLVEKDPSLEKSIQFAFRQNLHEISERCVEELRQFIAEYDAS
uniref:RIKEN cDNA 3110001I22 gene n=1 Tax=Peromyscus maniculatus bairdii TaxID=230844 RepID=A0A8C8W4Z7_PERMB|nr:periphilin-1-like [Peromyscus maniculatus bairdii]XP_042139451.1 periphilin-1-like [Peromyscus maniculatus bairdii]